jgi:hypothetical protein
MIMAKNKAEAILTGLFNFSAKEGTFDLISIPMDMGPNTIKHTSITFLNCRGITDPFSINMAMEKFTIRLMEKTESKLLMAVSETFSATSPLATWENKLEVGPPGAAASNINPTANSGDKSKPSTIK